MMLQALRQAYRLPRALRRGLAVGVFAFAGALAAFAPTRDLEANWGLSLLYGLRGTRAAPPQVTVIAINAHTAEQLGVPARADRWPRSLHAELITRLKAQGARVVAFDLLFDRSRDAADDRLLAQAMRQAGNVALVEYLHRDLFPAGGTLAAVERRIPPLPALADAALATAPFALPKTANGVFDYFAFAPEGDDAPVMPLVLAAAMGAGQVSRADRPHILQAARELARAAPGNRVALNIYGPPGHIHTVAYDQALTWLRQGAPQAQGFRQQAVLVGLSEFNQPEQRDAYRTTWSGTDGLDVSGVELTATALANQLDGSALKRLPTLAEAALLATLAASLMLPWALWSSRRAAGVTLGLATGYVLLAALLFARAWWWLPVAVPLGLLTPAAWLLGLSTHLRSAEARRLSLQAALHRYGDRDAIARLARELAPGSDTVYAVCMSSDIENYTRRVEGREPAEVRDWINRYFERAFAVVRAHGGQVVDHAGDSMVCIWLSGRDPQAACRAAVAAAGELHRLFNHSSLNCAPDPSGNDGLDHHTWPTRIGLDFGPVALGQLGDAQRAEWRVVGDIVNTASRIQGANKVLGTRVLSSEAVARHLPEASQRALGRFLMTGKSQPVALADPLPPSPQAAALFAQALAACRQGQSDAARAALEQLSSICPQDGPTRFVLAHLDAYSSGQALPIDFK